MITVELAGLTEKITAEQLPRYISIGWRPIPGADPSGQVKEFQAGLKPRLGLRPIKAGDEIIRLKPTVKTKATVTALELAKSKSKGDE